MWNAFGCASFAGGVLVVVPPLVLPELALSGSAGNSNTVGGVVSASSALLVELEPFLYSYTTTSRTSAATTAIHAHAGSGPSLRVKTFPPVFTGAPAISPSPRGARPPADQAS